MDSTTGVDELPDSSLLKIFSFLTAKELVTVSYVCRRWLRVGRDEQLWKRRIRLDFGLKEARMRTMEEVLWLTEYVRLVDQCPRVSITKIQAHNECVLHVSFNHDGSMMITCSEDGSMKIWNTKEEWKLLYERDLRHMLYWKWPLRGMFNMDGRLVLVSGQPAGNTTNGRGELAVFELVDKRFQDKNTDNIACDHDLIFRCRAINDPFDAYGCWFDNESILNAQSRPFNRSAAVSDLYFLLAASEQTTSTRLYQFYNVTGGVVRDLLVSSYSNEENEKSEHGDRSLIFTNGNRIDIPHQIGIKIVKNERVSAPLRAAANCMKARSENPPPSTILKNNLVKKVEPTKPVVTTEKGGGKDAAEEEKQPQAAARDTVQNEEDNMEEKKERMEKPKETGTKTEQSSDNAVDKSSSSEDESEDEQNTAPPQQAQVRVHTFDRIDHIIDIHGRIVGLALSPDHRYLFVHNQPFIDPDFNEPESILCDHAQYGHRLVDLDCNQGYIVSGGDKVYLWDRKYGCLIRSMSHDNGQFVHTVAMHPQQSDICVSASRDGTVFVWTSKNRERTDRADMRMGQ